MQVKLEDRRILTKDFETIGSLAEFKSIMICHDYVKSCLHVLRNTTECFYNHKKNRGTLTVHEYFQKFKVAADVVIHSGGDLSLD